MKIDGSETQQRGRRWDVSAAVSVTALLALGWLTLTTGMTPARAQCDDKCPPISVTVYDFDATSLQPASTPITDEGMDFMELYFASGGFYNSAFTTDPKHGCLQLFDATFTPKNHTAHVGDAFHPLLPGADGGAATDYLVSGKITGRRGAYTLAVSVLDSKTQESVAETTVAFANAGDALDAGGKAEAQLAPLVDKIRAFQKHKRDTDTTTAISARFTITPAKSEIKIGERTTVKLVLTDCDGTVLKDRKVTLSMSGPATVSPAQVTTNDQGEAQVTVTGGGKAGPATIIAKYPYTSVTHHESSAINGWAPLQIGDAPSGLWEVRVNVSQHFENPRRSNDPGFKETTMVNSQMDIGMVGWLTVHGGSAPGTVQSTDLLAVSGGGDYMQNLTENSRTTNTDTGMLISTSKANNTVSGTFEPGKMDMNSLSFVITAPTKGLAKLGIKPMPGTMIVAINGFPEKVIRQSHSVKKFYGGDAPPPQVQDSADTREETGNLISATAPTTAQMQSTQRYVIRKTEPANDKLSGTGETIYTITIRPIKLSQTPRQIRPH